MSCGKLKNQQQSIAAENNNFQISQTGVNLRKSSYLLLYRELITKYEVKDNLNLNNYKKKLRFNKIKIQSDINQSKQIYITNHTKGFQAVELLVKVGRFIFQLKALNFNFVSTTDLQLQRIGFGSFGRVYKYCNQQKNNFAIKNIKYKSKQKQNQTLIGQGISTVIFQYCIAKLFSTLQIGPYIENLFGFDLIIYKDSIEFFQELCDQMKDDQVKQLVPCLKLMHSLNIIHGDIKPQNLMWSPKYLKNVFIDFGFSIFVKQKIGFQTYTPYFGTYQYLGPQMKQIFVKGGFGYVDLYYNYLYALQKIISQSKKVEPCLQTSYQSQNKQKFKEKMVIIKLINLVFERRYKEFQKLLQLHKEIHPQVIDFLKQSSPS